LDEQKNIIDQASEMDAKSVLICGDGEPTLDKDLLGIVEHASSKGMYSVIVTNGNIFGNDELSMKVYGISSDELVDFFHRNKASFIFKLESLDEELYENIVGVKGSFKQLMEGLDKIYKKGFCETTDFDDGTKLTRISFSAVISKQNFHQVPKLKEYAHQHNAQFICKFPSFIGQAEMNKEQFFIPTEDATLWLRENYVRVYSEKPETLTTDSLHCGAWSYGAVVGESGDIRLCYSATCPSQNSVGNIREESLKKLLEKREKIFARLLTKGEPCHIKRSQYIYHGGKGETGSFCADSII
jgi:MoaA/NifB/PqqE/SkfB family radical SAM enzyme